MTTSLVFVIWLEFLSLLLCRTGQMYDHCRLSGCPRSLRQFRQLPMCWPLLWQLDILHMFDFPFNLTDFPHISLPHSKKFLNFRKLSKTCQHTCQTFDGTSKEFQKNIKSFHWNFEKLSKVCLTKLSKDYRCFANCWGTGKTANV